MILLPVKTDRPRVRPAPVTAGIVLVSAAVFALQALAPRDADAALVAIARFGFRGGHTTWETLLLHPFIHANPLQLGVNLFYLWVFGSLAEDVLRSWRVAVLYLWSLLTSALLTLVVGGPLTGTGAMAAAALGYCLIRFHSTHVEFFYFVGLWGWFWKRTWVAVIPWALWQAGDAIWTWMAWGAITQPVYLAALALGGGAAVLTGGLEQSRQEYATDDPKVNVRYLKHGESATAVEKALAEDPGNAYLMRDLARAYRRAGEYDRASQTYSRCVWRFVSRGMMEQGAECFVELSDYNNAVELPGDIEFALAAQLEGIRMSLAAELYRRVARRNPLSEEGARSLLRLPVLYTQALDRPSEALACLEEYLAHHPQSPEAASVSQWAERLRVTR